MKSFLSFHRLSLLAGLILLGSEVRAQEAPSSPLTLASALQRAAEKNPALAAQLYGERTADALIEQAGLRPNPTLDVGLENFAGTGRVQGVRSLETTVQASQAFERGGKREKRVTLASREREVAAKEFAVRRAEVLSVSALAYLETLAAQQRLALAAEPLKLARETVAAVNLRVKAGVTSPAESARARAAQASSQADFARAEVGLAAARAALAATWGGDATEVQSVTGSLQVPVELPAEAPFLAKLAVHPRLDLQQSVIAGRRAALELERAQAAQDVTVSGGVRFLREGTDAAFVTGVSVPIPFRNKNQGNIRAARETLAGAEYGVRAVEVELRAEFTAAWQALAAAHTAAQSLRRDAMPATEEAYAAVRRAYEQGQLPLIDVLDAQRALVALRKDLLETEIAYAGALTRAEALTDASFPAVSALIAQP
jgi:cobalt-zinc-cadmium efflux system outer membrane protein